jgi:hypothetical protein
MSLGTYVLAPGQNHRVVLGDTANGYVRRNRVRLLFPVSKLSLSE